MEMLQKLFSHKISTNTGTRTFIDYRYFHFSVFLGIEYGLKADIRSKYFQSNWHSSLNQQLCS